MSKHHNNRYQYDTANDSKSDEPDAIRLFIRRNRKKLLIALTIGVVLLLVMLLALGILLFTVIIPAGVEATNQFAASDQAPATVTGLIELVISWFQNLDIMQIVSLFLQSN
mgnify:CR=1 FL=1